MGCRRLLAATLAEAMKPVDFLVAHAVYTSGKIRSACMDLAPIVAVIAFFQLVVIRKPLPVRQPTSPPTAG